VFDSQPFQRSPAKRRRRSDNARQTNSTHDLEEGEADAEGSTDPDFDIPSISRRRVSAFASTVPATPEGGPSTTPFAPQKINRTKGRQLGQKMTYGRRLTKEEDIILANVCIARSSKYGIESMRRFWSKIRGKFEAAIDRKYAGVNRHINDLIIKRKADIKASHKSGHAARDDDYTQAIDGWIPIVQAYQKGRNEKSSSRKKKLEANAKHEKRRDRLSQRLKDKPDYELSSSSFSVASSTSNNDSSEDQSNSEDSSLNSIPSDVEEDANNNGKEPGTTADIVTGASPPPNDDAIMTGGLNDDDQYYAMRAFASEDDDDFPPILPSRSPPNRSTSPEPIELERSKTAKQSRKPTASAKSAGGKKTSKRSKQTRVSVTDNSSLGILQQTLSEYFKGQTQSTGDMPRQQPLLKKIDSMLQKNLVEMKKLYQAEKLELKTYFQTSFREYHENRMRPYFKHVFEGLHHYAKGVDHLIDQGDKLNYWVQRAVVDYLPTDEREYHARPEEADRSSREGTMASNAEAH